MDDPSRLWVLLFGALLCILVMAFFTACESAVTELPDAKLKKNAQTDKKWEKVQKLVSKPARIILAMSVFRLLMACAAAFLASTALGDTLAQWLISVTGAKSLALCTALEAVAILVIVLLATVLSCALGINFPKHLGCVHCESIALKFSGILNVLIILITPLEAIADGIVFVLCKMFGLRDFDSNQAVTEEEILLMVDAVNETGIIENSQREMISNIFEFQDMQLCDVMTHRTELCAIERNADIKDAILKVIDEGFSRIPVYKNTIDDIVGVIFAKDLISLLVHDNADKITIEHLMRDIIYVPETKSCDELFKLFTKTKSQIAVVVDEYGGTAGIVTMEDLLETIVGNIQDEYDNEVEEITKIDDNCYKVLGVANPDEVMERFSITLPPEHDFDTIGGFVIDLLGYIPEENQKPQTEYEDLVIKVLRAEDNKIEELLITRVEKKEETDEE